MNVLTVNPGSSSVKLAIIDSNDQIVIADQCPATADIGAALRGFVRSGSSVNAAAVRLVHGGNTLREPSLLGPELRARLDELATLAPLHNTAAVRALDTLAQILPETPRVVCVDTAFHTTIPDAAATYAIPWAWSQRYGIRKYGFHGLSHQYASRRAATMLHKRIEALRLVTCHLGSGASLAAIKGGVSIDTTMGFTPLDGLVMATRAGSVDPGVVIWLQRNAGFTAAEVAHELERGSGLLGISGQSGDLREVLADADRGDARAQLAIEVMLHRLVTSIGAMTAATGGIDALVFTGGIGEHSSRLRRAAADRLRFLGIALGSSNEDAEGDDTDISAIGARVRTLIVHAREDLELAREARALLANK